MTSAQICWHLSHLEKVQALHFKGGQGAKAGTRGPLKGKKVEGKIAQVHELKLGKDVISPATYTDLETPADFAWVADEASESSGGIPIGLKLSANHIEGDIESAL